MLLVIFTAALFTNANNIRVGINSYNPTTKVLNINLAWDHSWHDGSGVFRDAAWVFVKYKDVTDAEWKHATLLFPTTGNFILTDTLNNPGVKFDIVPKNGIGATSYRGTIVRRRAVLGANQNAPELAGVYNVGMKMDLTLASATGQPFVNPEFRVYALEMVDIPQAAFFAGDGTTGSIVGNSLTPAAPLAVTSEAQISYSKNFNGTTAVAQAPLSFPKGFAEYYIMKYELSNDAYAEFLNTLTRTQQNQLVNGPLATAPSQCCWSNGFSDTHGFANPCGIYASLGSLSAPGRFYAIYPCHPVINQERGDIKALSYLDWSGMRPMTGFEYEKACRGPVYPVAGEYAWGTSMYNLVVPSSTDIDSFLSCDERPTEVIDGPINLDHIFRVGAFARDSGATRLNSGGSYYGVMEMSNNMREFTVGYGSSTSPFSNLLGDGALAADGKNNIASWLNVEQIGKGTYENSTVSTGVALFDGVYSQPYIGIRGIVK